MFDWSKENYLSTLFEKDSVMHPKAIVDIGNSIGNNQNYYAIKPVSCSCVSKWDLYLMKSVI